MRGKVAPSIISGGANGITPAYAGKRQQLLPAGQRCQDHPRLCGEKQILSEIYTVRVRITPAYAGKRFLLLYF